MTHHNISFILVVAFLATLQLTAAVDYTVIYRAESTPGGAKFITTIGVGYTQRVLPAATRFIWSTFQQDTSTSKQNVPRVSVFIDPNLIIGGVEVPAYEVNNEIHLSAKYIQNFPGDVKIEITGILFHEMTHVWQWNGNNQAPGWLTEGIADFVRLKSGYIPSNWAKPREGDKWSDGYSVTARFLDYCNGLKNGFVAQLNNKLRDGYSDHYFVELLGKPVEQLWAEYKG